MYNGRPLQIHTSVDNTFGQTNLIETKPVRAQHSTTNLTEAKSARATMPDGAILLIPIFSLIVWLIVASKLTGAWKEARDRIVTFNHLKPVPCRNCRFFVNNHYLKCAVQPSIALTQQALNCSDYWPNNRHY